MAIHVGAVQVDSVGVVSKLLERCLFEWWCCIEFVVEAS